MACAQFPRVAAGRSARDDGFDPDRAIGDGDALDYQSEQLPAFLEGC